MDMLAEQVDFFFAVSHSRDRPLKHQLKAVLAEIGGPDSIALTFHQSSVMGTDPNFDKSFVFLISYVTPPPLE